MPSSLNLLREKVARLEAGAGPNDCRWPAVDPGLGGVTDTLPGGGLVRGAVHELLFRDAADGAATAFALRLLRHMIAENSETAFVWASCRDDLHAPGFAAAGVDPGRVLFVRCTQGQEVLWSVEESLRCPDLGAVVADVGPLDFATSRRLSLAATDSGVMLLLLMPWRPPLASSAAVTRWRIACAPGGRWQLDLLRCKGGRPHSWLVDPASGEADDDRQETDSLARTA